MHITARLEETTVKQLLRELLPLTVTIDEEGDGRWIRIDPARSVDFIAGEGLRVEVGGQLHWKQAGVPVLLTINSAQLILKPVVTGDAHGEQLVFRPSLEKMDLKNIPEFLDSGIAGIVNKRIEGQADKLAWHFGKTLTSHFPLDKDLAELATFDLGTRGATVEVTADAIVFTLSLTMGFSRHPAA